METAPLPPIIPTRPPFASRLMSVERLTAPANSTIKSKPWISTITLFNCSSLPSGAISFSFSMYPSSRWFTTWCAPFLTFKNILQKCQVTVYVRTTSSPSCDPAVPTTRDAPAKTAKWQEANPTPPDAPWMSTRSTDWREGSIFLEILLRFIIYLYVSLRENRSVCDRVGQSEASSLSEGKTFKESYSKLFTSPSSQWVNRTLLERERVRCDSHFSHCSIVSVEPHSIAHLEMRNGWSDLKRKRTILLFDGHRVGIPLSQLQLHQYREHKEEACGDRIYQQESLYPRDLRQQHARQLKPETIIEWWNIEIICLIRFRNQWSWDVIVNLDVLRSSEGNDRSRTHWEMCWRRRLMKKIQK